MTRRPPLEALRPVRRTSRPYLFGILCALCSCASEPAPGQRHEDFRRDPGWDILNNRLVPCPAPTTTQEFGYRRTNHAGAASGEIGGLVSRSLSPASYAKVIPEKTLNDRLSTSGTFSFTAGEGNAGVLFGWFNANSHGWRTNNSLVFRLDGNGETCWVLFDYGTTNWLASGQGTFEGRYQTTTDPPLPADGTPHQWSLTYDPSGASGLGEVTFVLDGKLHSFALLPGHKAAGAVFNRFGILNQQISGDGMTVYFDDLVIDGVAEDFSNDPQWEEVGNRRAFEDRVIRPLNDYGFSATGPTEGDGRLGGIVWRSEQPSYCADVVGPLTLEDELSASGTIVLADASSDAGAHIGWFNSAERTEALEAPEFSPERSLVAIRLEGPSRSGHFFSPVYRTLDGAGGGSDGPKIVPDRIEHEWSLHYTPDGADGRGTITVTLDGQIAAMDLSPGHKSRAAELDRFGIFNAGAGGHCLELYLDDLTYTARNP